MFNVIIYIETDVKGINRRDGTWGAVAECIDREGKPHTVEEYGHLASCTNNQITLRAMYKILQRIRKGCEVTISTENSWVVNMITSEQYKKWNQNNWRTARNEDIANKHEWIELSEIIEDYNITFEYHAEHSYKRYLENEIRKRKETHSWR